LLVEVDTYRLEHILLQAAGNLRRKEIIKYIFRSPTSAGNALVVRFMKISDGYIFSKDPVMKLGNIISHFRDNALV